MSAGRANCPSISRSESSSIFPTASLRHSAAGELGDAFSRYFSHRAGIIQRDLNELFRVGRRSLSIGVFVFVACFVAAHFAGGFLNETPFKRLVEESFLILGWVANWRPLEIFLYDWWPIIRRRDLYHRLSKAVVETKPYPAEQSNIPVPTAP